MTTARTIILTVNGRIYGTYIRDQIATAKAHAKILKDGGVMGVRLRWARVIPQEVVTCELTRPVEHPSGDAEADALAAIDRQEKRLAA